MDVAAYIHELSWADLGPAERRQAALSLTDTLGVAAAGQGTALSRIIRDHSAACFGGTGGALWFDGRGVSPPGAALANGMTIDSVDAHDGSKPTKGHVGCGTVAALLAAMPEAGGHEALTALAMAYEVGTRAGIALHASVADYHTSGAWIALAAAAIGARAAGLSREATHHALGIAEYHGPRSQMMRVIDHPTMLKDGSGWGAMAGLSAAALAGAGFTGAPAITLRGEAFADLGARWYLHEQYVKLMPVCRWAQPAVEAALAVQRAHGLRARDIAEVEVATFHEGCRLDGAAPATTEEAQYALRFPVAAALVRGAVGLREITEGLGDAEVLALAAKVRPVRDAAHDAAFPMRRIARARIVMADGSVHQGIDAEARGDPEAPLDDAAMRGKYDGLAVPALGAARAGALHAAVAALAQGAPLSGVAAALAEPVAP